MVQIPECIFNKREPQMTHSNVDLVLLHMPKTPKISRCSITTSMTLCICLWRNSMGQMVSPISYKHDSQLWIASNKFLCSSSVMISLGWCFSISCSKVWTSFYPDFISVDLINAVFMIAHCMSPDDILFCTRLLTRIVLVFQLDRSDPGQNTQVSITAS